MFKEGNNVLPGLFVVFQLLQEATNTDNNVFTLKFAVTDFVKLKYIAPLNWSLDLKSS